MESLREALYAEASGIPPLGDIDRAIRDVRAARRRWAGVVGTTAAALVLLVALVGPPWQPVTMEPVQPQPYPTAAPQGGAVIAWGSNEEGQTAVPGDAQTGVTAIAAGGTHSLALKDGRVIAWSGGRTTEGQADVPAEALSGVTAISAGAFHSLALKDGRVIAWGGNGNGQATVPAEAQSGVTAIAAGGALSLALKDGRVFAWGYGGTGETTVPVEAESGVTAIAAGDSISMALKDGQVIAWGHGVSDQDNVPLEARSGVTAIAAGFAQWFALKDGRVTAWGVPGNGQVSVPVDAQSGVTAIAVGGGHALALRDGRVIAWGSNDSGQATVPVEAQSGVTAIAAGGSVSMAIRTPIGSGDPSKSTEAEKTPAPPGSPAAADASAFAAAIAGAGVLTQPSAEDVALASDPSRYQWDRGVKRVSAAANFASLRACEMGSICNSGWAYETGSVDGGEVRHGLLGQAAGPELFELDDRFFVAIESSPDWPQPPSAWLIDSVSGGHSELTWRDEPTTVSSGEQALVLSERPWSVGRMLSRHGQAEFPELFLPRVVDGRDGTIRPLAVPENARVDIHVTQNGNGRIWIGVTPDDHDSGLSYSDDGGGTWAEIAVPPELPATAPGPDAVARAVREDLLVSVAADGDRIAMTEAWSWDNERFVYVSSDAGLSWSTLTVANPSGNGAVLYVLADGRLLMVRSDDPHTTQLLVSTASDWTKLAEDVQATQATMSKYVEVNRAGTISMSYRGVEEDVTILGGQTYFPPIRQHFSTDLVTWWTIPGSDN